MAIVRRVNAAEVEDSLRSVTAQGGNGLFLFFGSEDPATGASWCPDCVIADPILRAQATTLRPDLTLYECPVGARSDWKNRPEHPYRTHHQLRLQKIPTLIFFENGCERGRLVEADCAKRDLVAAFLR